MNTLKIAAIIAASTALATSLIEIPTAILTHSPDPANIKIRSKFNKLKNTDENDENYSAVKSFVKANGKGTLFANKKDNDWIFNYIPSGTFLDKNSSSLADWKAVKKFLDIHNTNEKIRRNKILSLPELYALYAASLLYGIAFENNTNSETTDDISIKKSNYVNAFFTIETLKYESDILEIISDLDLTEYKSELNELWASTDFENFNQDGFGQKIDEITDKYRPSDEQCNRVINMWEDDDWLNELGRLKITKSEIEEIMTSLTKKLDRYEKDWSEFLSKEVFDSIKVLIVNITKERLSSQLDQ